MSGSHDGATSERPSTGIDGYRRSLCGALDELVRKLHTLGRYLENVGVTVILGDDADAATGDVRASDAGISYLADDVVFLRRVEPDGELRKVVGVLKDRVGSFERTLREFERTADGVVVESVRSVRGVLRGTAPAGDPTER